MMKGWCVSERELKAANPVPTSPTPVAPHLVYSVYCGNPGRRIHKFLAEYKRRQATATRSRLRGHGHEIVSVVREWPGRHPREARRPRRAQIVTSMRPLPACREAATSHLATPSRHDWPRHFVTAAASPSTPCARVASQIPRTSLPGLRPDGAHAGSSTTASPHGREGRRVRRDLGPGAPGPIALRRARRSRGSHPDALHQPGTKPYRLAMARSWQLTSSSTSKGRPRQKPPR
jgi:hypothetical protein